MEMVLVILISLIWGSFLNMLAHRLLSGDSLLIARSFCPTCRHTIAWYDLFPVISYCLLRGQCRSCGVLISPLYPCVELMAVGAGMLIWHDYVYQFSPTPYFAAARAAVYVLLGSGLIVATRTDLQAMVIPQLVIVSLIPVGIIAAALGVLPVSLWMSVLGGVLGYACLWLLGRGFEHATGRSGIGEGDIELLAVLGVFFGPIGVWAILMTSSLSGSVAALIYLAFTGQGRNTRIPFGPFLSIAAFVYLYFHESFTHFLLG